MEMRGKTQAVCEKIRTSRYGGSYICFFPGRILVGGTKVSSGGVGGGSVE